MSRPTGPILRGPADADHYRVRVGRYGDRWYADPLPADSTTDATDGSWPSVSTVKNAAGKDWTSVALKRVAQAVTADPRRFDGLHYSDIYEQLKAVNKGDLGRAQRRGTNVHLMFERGLRGQPLTDPMDGDAAAEYLPAVQDFLNAYQPQAVGAELVCINRGLHGVGYGGTCDAIVRIDGADWIVDWKSRGADSDHGAYPEEGAQLGAYAGADYWIAAGPNGAVRQPVPQLQGGLIVSVRPDGVRVYPIDLQHAREHWVALHAWWVARRDERRCIGKPWAPRTADPDPDLENHIATAPDLDTLYAIWAVNEHRWTDSLTQLAAARKGLLSEGAAA